MAQSNRGDGETPGLSDLHKELIEHQVCFIQMLNVFKVIKISINLHFDLYFKGTNFCGNKILLVFLIPTKRKNLSIREV